MATNKKALFLEALAKTNKEEVTITELGSICKELDMPIPQWFTKDVNNRVSRGVYKTNMVANSQKVVNLNVAVTSATEKTSNTISSVDNSSFTENLVPAVYDNYVPFGHFDDLVSIFESKMYYPIFITGHSGNGKTMSVEQACAKLGRKFVLVSMTPDTDEGDLLGNYVLIDGQMVWRDGPVTIAAREGAVLCIDEIDYGAQNLSSLQRVLEGKPFVLKKKNETIFPATGFTVVATANTKGKGSDDGRYMFTNILNEAFLERFLNTYEQDWAPAAVEKKILKKELKSFNYEDDDFANYLVDWADVVRKTFNDSGVDEVISTRRLVFIAKTYSVFKDRMKAIELCLNRFDKETKNTFIDLYTKVDPTINPEPVVTDASIPDLTIPEPIPF